MSADTHVLVEEVCGVCGLARGTEKLAKEFRYSGGEHICWARDPKCLADACRWLVQRAEAAEAEVKAWEHTAKFYDCMEAAIERIVEIAKHGFESREDDEDGPATICSLCAMGLDAHDENCMVGIAQAALKEKP